MDFVRLGLIIALAAAPFVSVAEGGTIVVDPAGGARIFISGFTFQSLETPFDPGYPTSSSVCFTDNIVEECETGVDLRWADGLVARNVIAGPGYCGIQAAYFDGTIEANDIHGFVDAGIIGTNENTTVLSNHIHDNEIHGNADRDVTAYAGDQDPPLDFDATMNWWGTSDPGEIAEMIWDCKDSEWAGACFIVEPWCMGPACDATGAPGGPSSWGAIKAMYR